MGLLLQIGNEAIAIDRGQAFTWALTYGVHPNVSLLETSAASAERIWEASRQQFSTGRTRTRQDPVGPITLTIQDGARKVVVRGLYAIELSSGADFNTRTLTLVDRRWLWQRTFVERSYNIRRRTGDFRMQRDKLTPVQLASAAPDYGYRRTTINPRTSKRWKALEVLEDVLTELCGPGGFKISQQLKLTDAVEGVDLHDAGPDALSRVLALIPGARVFAGHDGLVHVASVYDGSEVPLLGQLGYPEAGDWRFVKRSARRPKVFRVYSDREVELRFDHVEERGPTESVGRTIVRSEKVDGGPGREALWLENVVINPLYELPLTSAADGPVATYGEAVELGKFIDAVNLLPWDAFMPLAPKLTKREIRRHWLGNWVFFTHAYARRADLQWDLQRRLVLDAIRTHYRQTYRVLPQWRDKVRALFPRRTAVIDFETGVRAPAAVFCDYLTKFSQVGYSAIGGPAHLAAANNQSWAENLSGAQLAPFQVQVIDSDLGLFRVAAAVDQTGTADTYVIGKTAENKLPSSDVANASVFWHQISLDPAFKLSVVLAATQDAPNGIGRLHETPVSLAEAAGRLGIAVPEATGADYDLVQTAEVARFGWLDKFAPLIRRAFFDGGPMPEGTFVNPTTIKDVAVSAAASMLVGMLDRAEGRVTHALHQHDPTGNMAQVVHAVRVDPEAGATSTTTSIMPGDLPGPSVWALMEPGPRAQVRKLVSS